MTRFFVRIDIPNRWATIHLRECRHARDHIAGITKAVSKRTWLGPFDTLDAAMEGGRQPGLRLFIDECKDCKPYSTGPRVAVETKAPPGRAERELQQGCLRELTIPRDRAHTLAAGWRP
jgi:hypothetical protein